jgi:hypothetical protein
LCPIGYTPYGLGLQSNITKRLDPLNKSTPLSLLVIAEHPLGSTSILSARILCVHYPCFPHPLSVPCTSLMRSSHCSSCFEVLCFSCLLLGAVRCSSPPGVLLYAPGSVHSSALYSCRVPPSNNTESEPVGVARSTRESRTLRVRERRALYDVEKKIVGCTLETPIEPFSYH